MYIKIIILSLFLYSCSDFKNNYIKSKNNIDSIEVITTNHDTVIIFTEKHVYIVPKNIYYKK